MRVAVVGAAGIMGSVIASDLDEDCEVVRLDRERRDGVDPVDARDPQQLLLAIEGCDVVVNAAAYRVNLTVMDAAVAARATYVDLGGLYHVAAKQYARHDELAAQGVLAVLGCGAGPGKTNVMAARAARETGRVRAIRCASAGHDEAGPSLPYARETLLDELREPPVVRRGGAAVAIEPLAPGGVVAFPEPVGERETLFTLHSEALTLGASLGADDVDFRLGLHPEVRRRLQAGEDLPPSSPRTWSAQWVEVTGDDATVTMTALTAPDEERGLGGTVVSTGCTAAAVARLAGRGALAGRVGCLAPEVALDFDVLAPELEARGCTFDMRKDTP